MKNYAAMTTNLSCYFIAFIAAFCAAFMLITPAATAAPGENITQNWEAAAVFYDSPCTDTETFHMTEQEFYEQKTELEAQVIVAYSNLYQSVSRRMQPALKQAQSDWISCYYAYLDALAQRWQDPVKIYFGDPYRERRTILYRDFALVMLYQRLDDLTAWRQGELAYVETKAVREKEQELDEAKEQLQVDMGLCLYVIDEPYREKIMTAHRAFFTFADSNSAFIKQLSRGKSANMVAEELLQVQRMSRLTKDHYYGCRFFRREREE